MINFFNDGKAVESDFACTQSYAWKIRNSKCDRRFLIFFIRRWKRVILIGHIGAAILGGDPLRINRKGAI